MMVAMHNPERNVQRLGKGTLKPKSSRRPAYCHHLAIVMIANIVTTVAMTETGRITEPGTGFASADSSPFEIALVKAL
jgi:hypothetical protein